MIFMQNAEELVVAQQSIRQAYISNYTGGGGIFNMMMIHK